MAHADAGQKLEFRNATQSDAAALTALARDAKASWGYPAAWQAAWAQSLQVTPDYIGREVVWLAVHDGDIAGFYALVARGQGRWLLDHFWVRPAWQGQGVGRAMFEHVVERVRALRPGVLVIESDPNAAGFYVRMGAREVGSLVSPVKGDPLRRLPVLELTVDAV